MLKGYTPAKDKKYIDITSKENLNERWKNGNACCSRRRKSACGFIWRYKNG